jgi:hypothetical protein
LYGVAKAAWVCYKYNLLAYNMFSEELLSDLLMFNIIVFLVVDSNNIYLILGKSDMSMNISGLNDTVGIENLPDEVMLKVFSHLNPQALCRSAQVSHRWNSLAMDGSLWTQLYPVSWAKGM